MSTTITQEQFAQNQLKIDELGTDGLAGASNSLAYRVHEIEKHLHSAGRHFGWGGENATALHSSIIPWTLTAGTGAYGTAIQILKGDEDFDLPFTPVKFDHHLLSVVDASEAAIYRVRMANSVYVDGVGHTYASMAEAVTANQYTVLDFSVADANKAPNASLDVQTGRANVGSMVWAQVISSTNGASIDVLLGVHAYGG